MLVYECELRKAFAWRPAFGAHVALTEPDRCRLAEVTLPYLTARHSSPRDRPARSPARVAGRPRRPERPPHCSLPAEPLALDEPRQSSVNCLDLFGKTVLSVLTGGPPRNPPERS